VEIGVGLDRSLGLSWEQYRELARHAARIGYQSVWTNAGIDRDPMHICAQWSVASAEVVPGGLGTGISVIPVGYWTAPALASCAGTVGEISGGKFVLGIGSGAIHNPAFRKTLGLPDVGPIGAMREYLTTVRALLAGETVTHEGKAITLNGVSLGFTPPKVPVALGALGPQMLRLAGAASDGAALNWCDAERVAEYRRIVAEGARSAGRDPSEVAIIEYIRICVDDDEDAARRAYVKSLMGYAMARPGVSKELGYRGHFARMGFDEQLTELEERRDRGASDAELVDAFPVELARQVGYFGPASGAAAAFRRLAEGLDTAIVRVVAARPGLDAITAVMEACQPSRLPAG
jgi:alkanesulfonate monooxygenase SsuD/methylene tetrahydromethanopterin reductase-like flavin-dependent oxidoreductase (luciferase family)